MSRMSSVILPMSLTAEFDLDPYHTLEPLLDHPERAERPWTSDIAEVELRLVSAVGPNTLEHRCTALLQLENPKHIWMHVGGSGDGGVDGIGADESGTVVGLLQSKWAPLKDADPTGLRDRSGRLTACVWSRKPAQYRTGRR
jgi:hypothetical protein